MATPVDSKLLKKTKFPPEFSRKVDMTKVNIEVMKKWIAKRISDILGNEDDVVIELCFNLLEGTRYPDIKSLQIQLTGFLDKDTPKFCKELWSLCLSGQENPQGVPKELLEAKKQELMQEKLEAERAAEAARREREEERIRERELNDVRRRERSDRGDRGERGWDNDIVTPPLAVGLLDQIELRLMTVPIPDLVVLVGQSSHLRALALLLVLALLVDLVGQITLLHALALLLVHRVVCIEPISLLRIGLGLDHGLDRLAVTVVQPVHLRLAVCLLHRLADTAVAHSAGPPVQSTTTELNGVDLLLVRPEATEMHYLFFSTLFGGWSLAFSRVSYISTSKSPTVLRMPLREAF
ncbi:Uncharacterized protein PECH_000599 [Penicillium ucsense]|uniref:PWI domain-containing protein n=1 Tax=Penicillium ucsense TaxID=2839758 RepID=A0A8J8W0H6_9EURO|nr:Uncharacterized protein PECM_000576 [Penicillium ucsense]KAF7733441.1 Uncharacterized protein PECH_000599 [Penicillium ucsense]